MMDAKSNGRLSVNRTAKLKKQGGKASTTELKRSGNIKA